MKKIIAVLLSLLTVSTFAGGKQDAAASGVKGPKGSLPLSDGKTTFTVFVGDTSNAVGSGAVSSFAVRDNIFSQNIVKDTGINLEITSASGLSITERLNLMLSTGTYPDIIICDSISQNDLIYYANQGIFIPMDGYDPMGYPQIKAAFDKYPSLNQILRGPDGKLYALPMVNECLHCIYQYGRFWYNMPWIRDNNRKAPETLDELTDFLRFVKNNDLNKNGKKDEIPLAFDLDNIRNFVSFIAKAYMPFVNATYYGLALDGKKIVEQYKDPNFREALKYMAGLYKEGLILPDSFTLTIDQLRTLVDGPEPVIGIYATSWITNYETFPSRRFAETFHLPALKGPKGQQNAGNGEPWSIGKPTYMITDKCKDPELAVALYNYFLDFTIMLNGYIGPKGQSWTDPDPGAVGIDGSPAKYKMLVALGSQAFNTSWAQPNPMIRTSEFRLGEQSPGGVEAKRYLETGDPSLTESISKSIAFTEQVYYWASMGNMKYTMPQSLFIPPLALDDADNARVADITATLETYKTQSFVEFIAGKRDINSNSAWNNYLAELDRLGSAELVKILQKYIK
jgi:putative aldouronate transport system substrate-binding protein